MVQFQYIDNKSNTSIIIKPSLPTFKLNRLVSAKIAIFFGIAVGTVFITTPAAFAQLTNNSTHDESVDNSVNAFDSQSSEQNRIKLANMPTATLPMVTVVADPLDNPDYAGGQVTSTNHAGFLGNKDYLETPFNAISYTEKFIKDKQATDITAVIADTDPSVYSSGVGGQNLESYNIRGFASSIGDVTVGGLFGMAPYYRSSPEMFERIEVLKGPSALLNGMSPKGSVGGAVNLVPKRATDAPITQVTARYISDSQLGGHVDVGRRFGDHNQFGVRVNGAYRDGDSPVNNQAKQAQLVSAALDWRGERVRLSTDLYQSEEHVDGPTRGISLAPGVALPKPLAPESLLNPDWAYNDAEDVGMMARAEFDVNDQLMAYAALGKSETDFKSQSAYRATVINDAGDYITKLGEVDDNVERRSAEVGVKGEIDTGSVGHQIAFNVSGYDEDYYLNARFLRDMDVTTNLYNPQWPAFNVPLDAPALLKTNTRLTSVGVADTLSFAEDKYQLTLGVRQQQVESKDAGLLASGFEYDESATTPSVAFLAKLTDQVSLYGNYIEGLSMGERAPIDAKNAGEVFAPYKTKQKEVGLKFDFGDFGHTFSAYEIKKPNSYLDPTSNIFSSAGEQRNRGVEWSFFGAPIDDIRLMGGVAYIDAKLTKTVGGTNNGNQAVGVPKLQSKLGVEWDQPYIPNLTLTANTTSVSKQYINANNDVELPGYTVYDLGARYQSTLGGYPLTIRSSIENVTNKAYWAKPHYLSLGLGEPRTFMLSATMDF